MLIKNEKISFVNGFSDVSKGEYYYSDVLEAMPTLIEKHGGTVKLVYFDPPFMTGREFDASVQVGEKGFSGDKDYIVKIPSYSDKWQTRNDYLAFLKKVVEGAKELLNDEGVICVHVDRHSAAYVKLLLDDVFGENCFINEIIWHYHSGGSSKTSFPAKHDNLYIYGKNDSVKIFPGAAGFARGDKRINHMKKNVDEDGRVYFSINSNGKEYRYFEDDIVSFDDVWDIPHLQQKHPERTGFGTQKPLALLNRIVRSCSHEGDTVCDLFSGSGTTVISAAMNKRRFIGVDKSALSLLTFKRRIAELECVCVDVFQNSATDVNSGLDAEACVEDTMLKIKVNGYSALVDSSLPKYEDTTEYLTYLAVGHIEDGTFYTDDFSFRSAAKPKLKTEFKINGHENATVYFCDCLGNHGFVKL